MWKTIVSLASAILGTDAQLVGSQHDTHGCVMDGGYRWCEPLNRCVRPWETPCVGPLNNPANRIPADCVVWFDGCNRCMVRNGQKIGCTKMMCLATAPPQCLSRAVHTTLSNNDVCYRFCEDGSEPSVDRRHECPSGTTCASVSTSNMVGFDNCGSRALRCLMPH